MAQPAPNWQPLRLNHTAVDPGCSDCYRAAHAQTDNRLKKRATRDRSNINTDVGHPPEAGLIGVRNFCTGSR
jgi:hypothetical protein